MDSIGTYVEGKYALATKLSLETIAEKLARPSYDHGVAEPLKREGLRYFIKINYKDVPGLFVPVDVWMEQAGEGAGRKIIFSILTRYKDGRSERHLLNGVARLLEEICIK